MRVIYGIDIKIGIAVDGNRRRRASNNARADGRSSRCVIGGAGGGIDGECILR